MREPHDPFDVLGVASTADEQALRAAFRALALRHHPDRNPNDPEAAEHFKRVMRAYRAALRRLRGEPAPRRRSAPPSGRYRCPGCGDRFIVADDCVRCDLAPEDLGAGVAASAPDPSMQLDPWAVALEERGPRARFALPKHAPMWLAGAFLAGGATVYALGPLAPAILCAAFGAWVLALEAHGRWRAALTNG